jgi:hypothetical protein
MSADFIQNISDIVTSAVTLQELEGFAAGAVLAAVVITGIQLVSTFGSVREHPGPRRDELRHPSQRTVGQSASPSKLQR